MFSPVVPICNQTAQAITKSNCGPILINVCYMDITLRLPECDLLSASARGEVPTVHKWLTAAASQRKDGPLPLLCRRYPIFPMLQPAQLHAGKAGRFGRHCCNIQNSTVFPLRAVHRIRACIAVSGATHRILQRHHGRLAAAGRLEACAAVRIIGLRRRTTRRVSFLKFQSVTIWTNAPPA